jgi:GTP cyclohydrolase II
MLILSEPISIRTELGIAVARHVLYRDDESLDAASKEGIVVFSPQGIAERPRVRLQSSCLFGEALWATDCDCGQQLSLALDLVLRDRGLLVYFYEEGRGAGLRKKFEAIRLQQTQGLDTDAAFECLQLKPDLRSYRAAAEVLKNVLGTDAEIVLLTNNPRKADALRSRGVRVVHTENLIAARINRSLASYMVKKSELLWQKFPDAVMSTWKSWC